MKGRISKQSRSENASKHETKRTHVSRLNSLVEGRDRHSPLLLGFGLHIHLLILVSVVLVVDELLLLMLSSVVLVSEGVASSDSRYDESPMVSLTYDKR